MSEALSTMHSHGSAHSKISQDGLYSPTFPRLSVPTFALSHPPSTMPSLLTIPRELRDEIIDLVVFSDLAAPTQWQTCTWSFDLSCPHPAWEPTWPSTLPDTSKLRTKTKSKSRSKSQGASSDHEVHNPAKVLLLVNHQLHAETLQRAAAVTVPYTVDLLLMSTRDAVSFQPTWITAPLHVGPQTPILPRSGPPPTPIEELRVRIRCVDVGEESGFGLVRFGAMAAPVQAGQAGGHTTISTSASATTTTQHHVLNQHGNLNMNPNRNVNRPRDSALCDAIQFFLLHFLTVRNTNVIPYKLWPHVLASVPRHEACEERCCRVYAEEEWHDVEDGDANADDEGEGEGREKEAGEEGEGREEQEGGNGEDEDGQWATENATWRYIPRYAVRRVRIDVVTDQRELASALSFASSSSSSSTSSSSPSPSSNHPLSHYSTISRLDLNHNSPSHLTTHAQSFCAKLTRRMDHVFGAGFAKRALFTRQDELVWQEYERPVLQRLGRLEVNCLGQEGGEEKETGEEVGDEEEGQDMSRMKIGQGKEERSA
ncbi:hypothetical protein K491DRAFT_447454 [Lophiostoma macrostomum CBS 122681]|uniref:F-box domain-containing protein n=1 Tax=Lophiostoma macrostomum CBS 122681 TaxID=1314788 RepID=A0A6A6TMI0_9PLEO|nr:hypothetical protein K491DRAFT_447454 [Lophiostoma macrostomum CBS 122681]